MAKAPVITSRPLSSQPRTRIANPDEGQQFSDGKYKVTCLLEKNGEHDDFIQDFESKCEEAALNEWDKIPQNLYTPIKDGDENQKEDFHNHWLIT